MLLLFFVSMVWKPVLIFTIPGILILVAPIFKKISLVKLLIYIIGTSMCFWICSFWFLKFLPLKLSTLFSLCTTVTLVAFYFLFKRKKHYRITVNSRDLIIVGLFLFIFFLRLLPMFYAVTAAGADMSMHTYTTELIVRANGVPESYQPILEIDAFNSVPVGFHTLSALISLLGGIDSFKSAFIMRCLAYAFLTIFLFAFLEQFVSWESAFISSACFTFFASNPQGFISCGGNAAIFALALFFLFLSSVDLIKNNKYLILLPAVYLAAVLLSHFNIFMQSFYMFTPAFLIYCFLKKEHKQGEWIKYVWFLLFFFIIAMPYLFNVDFKIASPYVLRWIKDWVSNPSNGHVWKGTISNFIWTIPFYIIKWDGIPVILLYFCAFGLIFLFYKNKEIVILYTCSLVTGVLLILNIKYWVLPFSYAIYPERVAMMIIIPLSLFFAYALQSIGGFFNKKFYHLLIMGVMVLICIKIPYYNKIKYLRPAIEQCSVTEADIEAFGWLRKHSNTVQAICNNYGDGGLWIPAIIFRRITYPHVTAVYVDKIERFAKAECKYIYIGNKQVYPCSLEAANFQGRSEYKQVYAKDGVYIYEVL